MNPKLVSLLESGQFEWDNDRHREAYLRAWAAGVFSPHPPRDARMAVGRGR